ncbi:MAG: two-component system, OmpR family, response regulator [Actinomycetota bacterium]|nr:two-component system, OmpR family, response regulator [Actinomycetota bacterium]
MSYAIDRPSHAVGVVRWPAEADRRDELERLGIPRLLLVDAGAPPPEVTSDEDWVRLPVGDEDLRARVERLAQAAAPRPTLDEYGVLTHGDGWVGLSPLEESIVRMLLDSFGTTVSRTDLADRAWPDGGRGPRALDTKIHRIRHRLAPLGLAIHTVRRRGFVLGLARPEPSVRSEAEEPTWPIS